MNQWGIDHATGIPPSPTGQSIVERTHQNIKRILNQQRGGTEKLSPIEQLCKVLFTINFLNNSFEEPLPPVFRHFSNSTQAKLQEQPPVLIKDPENGQIRGPFPLIIWGRGYARFHPVRTKVDSCQEHQAIRRRRRQRKPNKLCVEKKTQKRRQHHYQRGRILPEEFRQLKLTLLL